MVGQTATGTLSYNGYEFDGSARVTCSVKMIKDDAGMSIVAHEITIRVRAVVADGGASGTDEELLDIRTRLGQSGKKLIFKDKGFGDDLRVNAGHVRDINHGPTPQELLWAPLGDNKCAEIEWEVVTTIPPCPRYGRFVGISSLVWSSTFAIDMGETTRTLSGYIEIAMNKLGQDTADAYRHHFVQAPLAGFSRTQNWDISDDLRRCTFQIVDTQIQSDNAYPKHVLDIDARHRVSYRPLQEGDRPTLTLSASITPDRGFRGSDAWQIFLELVQQRVHTRKSKKAKRKRRGRDTFLLGLEAEEDLFGRTHEFRLEYSILTKIADLMQQSGLWTALDTNWNLWARSLGNTAFHQRGSAKLTDIAANHAIVDLCTSAGSNIANNLTPDTRGLRPKTVIGTLENDYPNVDTSWLDYEVDVEIDRYRPVTMQSVLQEEEPNTDDGAYDVGGPATIKQRYGSVSKNIPDEIQVGGQPRYIATLHGKATRAGHEIPRPVLKKVGKLEPVEAENNFRQKKSTDIFKVPVYKAAWVIHYFLEGNPGDVTPPPTQDDFQF